MQAGLLCRHDGVAALNQRVQGSSPCAPTNIISNLAMAAEDRFSFGVISGVTVRRALTLAHRVQVLKPLRCARRYAASGCAKAASNFSSAQSISPRVITRGGLTRMVWSWVSLHRTPRRRSASQ